MDRFRSLGDDLKISPIGLGLFKIGRNFDTKYNKSYPIPSLNESMKLLQSSIDLGINWFDTAPSYGDSEDKIGLFLKNKTSSNLIISTKFGENYNNHKSEYNFTIEHLEKSIHRSLENLNNKIDILFIHSNGQEDILSQDVIHKITEYKKTKLIKLIGFSVKTENELKKYMDFTDVFMIEYNLKNKIFKNFLNECPSNKSIVIKKIFNSGNLISKEEKKEIIKETLSYKSVKSIAISSLNPSHIEENFNLAMNFLNK